MPFLDVNGVPVIIQAKASQDFNYSDEEQFETIIDDNSWEIKALKGSTELYRILKENKRCLFVNDIRDSNLGYYNDTLAILDFGISTQWMTLTIIGYSSNIKSMGEGID